MKDETLERRSREVAMPGTEATTRDRIKYLITVMRKTQAQFAAVIGIDPPNLSRVLSPGGSITDSMLNRIVVNTGASKQWLLDGSEVPFPRGHAHDVQHYKGVPAPQGAPVYDIDATAGFGELSRDFTDDRIIGRLNLPQINPDNVVVRVSGDSMKPSIPNGSLISIRPIQPDSPIFWGQTYLVVLEDYRMVKILRRVHHDPDSVILHSTNPDYDDMEIKRRAIKNLFVVDAVITCEVYN